MVLRIHYLFQHTSLALTKRSRIVHGIIIALSPVWIVIMVILQSFEQYQMYYQYTSIGLIVVLMLGSIHLLFLFNRSLFQLLKQDKMKNRPKRVKSVSTLTREQSITQSQSTTVSTKTRVTTRSTGTKRKTRAEANQTLLNTIVKHNFLTWVIISMFLCFVVMFGLLSFGMEWNDTQKYALWWIQCLSINAATFCIFLGFNINNSWYDVICGKCDVCCGSICRFGVERQLGRYIEESEKEDQRQMEISAANQTPISTTIGAERTNGFETPVGADTFGETPVGRQVTDLVESAFDVCMDDGNETIQVDIDLDIQFDTQRSNEPDPDLIETV